MRRSLLRALALGAALVAPIALAAPAGATILFPSTRCVDAQDRENFLSSISCPFRLWSANDDGGNPRMLGNATAGMRLARLSPERARFAYVRDRYASGDSELRVAGLAGLADVRVGPGPGPPGGLAAVWSLDWAPDGKRLVAHITSFAGGVPGLNELVLVDADGSGYRKLDSPPANDANPVFTPDGRSILFRRHGTAGLVSLDLATGAEAPAAFGDAPALGVLTGVSFSPDARAVALRTDAREVYSLGVHGGGLRYLPAGEKLEGGPGAWIGNAAFTATTQVHGVFETVVIDAGNPGLQPRPLIPSRPVRDGAFVIDGPVSWRGPDRGPVADATDPLLDLIGTPAPAAARRAAKPRRVVSRARRLGLVAFDTAGIRRVEASLARRGRARPAYRRLRSAAALRKLARRAGPGTYRLRIRVTDRRRNVRSRAFTLVLRR